MAFAGLTLPLPTGHGVPAGCSSARIARLAPAAYARAASEEIQGHPHVLPAGEADSEAEPLHRCDEPPVIIYLADHLEDPEDDHVRWLEENIVN